MNRRLRDIDKLKASGAFEKKIEEIWELRLPNSDLYLVDWMAFVIVGRGRTTKEHVKRLEEILRGTVFEKGVINIDQQKKYIEAFRLAREGKVSALRRDGLRFSDGTLVSGWMISKKKKYLRGQMLEFERESFSDLRKLVPYLKRRKKRRISEPDEDYEAAPSNKVRRSTDASQPYTLRTAPEMVVDVENKNDDSENDEDDDEDGENLLVENDDDEDGDDENDDDEDGDDENDEAKNNDAKNNNAENADAKNDVAILGEKISEISREIWGLISECKLLATQVKKAVNVDMEELIPRLDERYLAPNSGWKIFQREHSLDWAHMSLNQIYCAFRKLKDGGFSGKELFQNMRRAIAEHISNMFEQYHVAQERVSEIGRVVNDYVRLDTGDFEALERDFSDEMLKKMFGDWDG